MILTGDYGQNGMPYEEIDGVPIWFEERGDPAGPPLVALHGGILTFERSFGDVLPWLTEGRRVIGAELQGHGHTADTGRSMSFERFADDIAELIDRVAGGLEHPARRLPPRDHRPRAGRPRLPTRRRVRGLACRLRRGGGESGRRGVDH
jgi:alpha-beta hydrolase superfamily lysophospholipase